ncbi:MAG: hypothetical protein KatS3mg005_4149 [Bryobacteraceae bacterium]|nr:MAG: hypothetical protein KatS3mg005_4149 [Bryobacteraceae bacterium]
MNTSSDRLDIALRGIQAVLILAGAALVAVAILESRRRMRDR